MGSSIKAILILATLAIVSCHVRAQEADDSATTTTEEYTPYVSLNEFGGAIEGAKPVSENIQKAATEQAPVKNSCEFATAAAAAAAAAKKEEQPKTEQVVIKKAGKKYRVITITLPIEAEDRAEPDAAEPSVPVTTEPSVPVTTEAPKIETSPEVPFEETDLSFDYPEEPEEVTEQPKTETKTPKVKANKSNKKYKRDVGKKPVDKKSSKRKNKQQEKRKSKK